MLRLAFFFLAPFGIVPIAALFPVTGTLVGTVLAILVFLAAETFHGWTSRSRVLRFLVRRELEMEAFYRSNPPKPFLYYVFYPLLFPYWLYRSEARREFWFFRGYTASGIAIVLAMTGVEYFRHWWPELGLRHFLPIVAITLVAETVLVLSLLMPVATTVIAYHARQRRGRLSVLLLVALLSTSFAIARLAQKRDPVVSYATRHRVALRTEGAPDRALNAKVSGLRAAWAVLQKYPKAISRDGKVEGGPLDAAHGELEKFYLDDETEAFDLWAEPPQSPEVLVLYTGVGFRKRGEGHWVGLRSGQVFTDPNLLPPGAFVAMRKAARK